MVLHLELDEVGVSRPGKVEAVESSGGVGTSTGGTEGTGAEFWRCTYKALGATEGCLMTSLGTVECVWATVGTGSR